MWEVFIGKKKRSQCNYCNLGVKNIFRIWEWIGLHFFWKIYLTNSWMQQDFNFFKGVMLTGYSYATRSVYQAPRPDGPAQESEVKESVQSDQWQAFSRPVLLDQNRVNLTSKWLVPWFSKVSFTYNFFWAIPIFLHFSTS